MDAARRSARVPKPKWDTDCVNPEVCIFITAHILPANLLSVSRAKLQDVPLPRCAEDDIPPPKPPPKRLRQDDADWGGAPNRVGPGRGGDAPRRRGRPPKNAGENCLWIICSAVASADDIHSFFFTALFGRGDASQGGPRQYQAKRSYVPLNKKRQYAESGGRGSYPRPVKCWGDPKLQSAMSFFVKQLFRSSGSGWATVDGISELTAKRATSLVVALKPAAGPVCDVLDRCMYKSLEQLLADVQLVCQTAAEQHCAVPQADSPTQARQYALH